MDENQKKKERMTFIGLIALIAVLIGCVFLIFGLLERVIPTPAQPPAASVEAEQTGQAPSFCPHCGEGLPDSFAWGQFCPYCGEKVD